MELYRRLTLFFVLIGIAFSAQSREIAGVNLPETVQVAGAKLALNGAGIRYKFLFKIYVASLYLEKRSDSLNSILEMPGPKRIGMNFTYSHVSKENLVDSFNEGFEKNIPSNELEMLKPRIDTFNNLFGDVKEGDVVLLDYVPDEGTRVMINDNVKGVVEGADFYHALMLIWIGKDPVGSTLKLEMLGIVDKNGD